MSSVSPISIKHRCYEIQPDVVTDRRDPKYATFSRWMATEEDMDTPEFYGDSVADLKEQIDAAYAEKERKIRERANNSHPAAMRELINMTIADIDAMADACISRYWDSDDTEELIQKVKLRMELMWSAKPEER